MGEKDWGKQSDKYGEIVHHDYIFTPAFKKIVEVLKLQKKKVMDVGCGAGEQSRILGEEYGCNVLGVDISKSMIDRAIKETKSDKISYEVTDAKSFSQKNGEFDAVFMNTLLCNIPSKKEVEKIIKESSRVLKPEGFLIISNPHPIFENYSFPKRRERTFPENFNYFNEGQRYFLKLYKTDGTALEVENFHYPLETYIDLIFKSGMKVTQIIEPRSPLDYEEEKKIPVYIIIISQKNG